MDGYEISINQYRITLGRHEYGYIAFWDEEKFTAKDKSELAEILAKKFKITAKEAEFHVSELS